MPNAVRTLIVALLLTGGTASTRASSMSGPVARSDFFSWTTNHGGVLLNFNQQLSGAQLQNQLKSRLGVTFVTTSDAQGQRLKEPTPVVVSASYAYSLGRLTIVGSPCKGCFDDRECDYEIRFETPQRWPGLQRYWTGPTITRFVAADGDVLHEFEGEGFHGWLSDADDRDSWVSRIEITGPAQNGSRQVGYSDDLIYGTNTIPRALSYLSLRATSQAVLDGLQRPRFGFNYEVRGLGDTNEWFIATSTNRLAPGTTNRPFRPASRDLLIDPE